MIPLVAVGAPTVSSLAFFGLFLYLYLGPKLWRNDRRVMRDSRIRRFLRWLLLRKPDLDENERIVWQKLCNWIKGGNLSKGGRRFITSSGRIIWMSARYDLPYGKWATKLSDLAFVEFEEGGMPSVSTFSETVCLDKSMS
jgi:hypothetical protein